MINLLEIEKALDLLSTFQLSYPSNGRLPLTNGLSTVPDSKMPDGEDKINLKNLYEMSGHKKSHGLVSIRFLGVLAFFFFWCWGKRNNAAAEQKSQTDAIDLIDDVLDEKKSI